MDAFKMCGFLTIGALKTNRIIYPVNVRMSIRDLASHLRTKSPAVHLVIVNETDINPPAELGRLTDASGDEQSPQMKTPIV